ncbi:hypothetical protein [Streptomyces sp. 3N207]|uniref:hypothetical protein n=1 Tax=Streptomyces sp. 3N207 TaxID=3457417 RepID=UPI003FD03753
MGERTISWLYGFRRPRIRWERRDDVHEAFLGLANCLSIHRHVQDPEDNEFCVLRTLTPQN